MKKIKTESKTIEGKWLEFLINWGWSILFIIGVIIFGYMWLIK